MTFRKKCIYNMLYNILFMFLKGFMKIFFDYVLMMYVEPYKIT